MRKRIHDTSVTHSLYNQYRFGEIENFVDGKTKVYIIVYSNEGNVEPHFHLEALGDSDNTFNAIIKLEDPDYMPDTKNYLTYEQILLLDDALSCIGYHDSPVWDEMKEFWNTDDLNEPDINKPFKPDYRLLPNKE